MIFGKARLIFAGQEPNSVERAVQRIQKIPNGHLMAAFTEYEDAVSYAQAVGCDAVLFDCASDEGEQWKKQLHEFDPDIIPAFRDGFFVNGFGWCKYNREYSDPFQHAANCCWMDAYQLPKEYRYKEILDSIDKKADSKSLFHDLPEEIKRHSQRVADMTVSVMEHAAANRLLEGTEYVQDLHAGYMDYLHEAALLHDVGKAFLPAWLLEKKAPLTRAERTLYHMHAQFGDELLKPLEIPLMIDESLSGEPLRRYMAQSCAAYHHELAGSSSLQIGHEVEDTPIWAQVCGIVNLWDNMLHEGLDGKTFTESEALDWMNENKSLFTKEAYEVFVAYKSYAG